MSKINAIRLININYNNNTMKVSDEIFQLNCDSTLLSLRNGGGKSVLVQMMIAPFVHKKYRNTKDRPFSSYFTTSKPSFILVEWKLDHGAGYVLTGMMIRKNQNVEQNELEELEIINMISEYKNRCTQDIYNLPVVERTKKEVILKNFNACKQLFETYKKERGVSFLYFDMNNSSNQKQYFDKLQEYQINYKEWESIIKKVNLKESGLSDLFSDCRDEKGLVDKWFLESIYNKLNKDKDRIREFQKIIEKYAIQFKDNKSKIQRRDTINQFKEEAVKIRELANNYQLVIDEKEYQESKIACFINTISDLLLGQEIIDEKLKESVEEIYNEIEYAKYEKISKEIYKIKEKENYHSSNYEMINIEKEELEEKKHGVTKKLHLQICAKQEERVREELQELQEQKHKLAISKQEKSDLEPKREKLGNFLMSYYTEIHNNLSKSYKDFDDEVNKLTKNKTSENGKLKEYLNREKEIAEQIGELNAKIGMFGDYENRFNKKYNGNWNRNILGEYSPGSMSIEKQNYEKEINNEKKNNCEYRKSVNTLKEKETVVNRNIEENKNKLSTLSIEKDKITLKLQDFEKQLEERKTILKYVGLKENNLFDLQMILTEIKRKQEESYKIRRDLEKEYDLLDREYKKLEQGIVLELSSDFKEMLEEADISYVYGMDWLNKNNYSLNDNQRLVKEQPFLPYSLILSKQEIIKIKNYSNKIYTAFPIPIVAREELENDYKVQTDAIISYKNLNFYIWYNEELLDDEKLRYELNKKAKIIKSIEEKIKIRRAQENDYLGKYHTIKTQTVNSDDYQFIKDRIINIDENILGINIENKELLLKIQEIKENIISFEKAINSSDNLIRKQETRLEDFIQLEEYYEQYLIDYQQRDKSNAEKQNIINLENLSMEKIDKLHNDIKSLENKILDLDKEINDCKLKIIKFKEYNTQAINEGETIEAVIQAESEYDAITNQIDATQKDLEERVYKGEKRYEKENRELQSLFKKYSLDKYSIEGIRYSEREESHLEVQEEEYTKKIKVKDMYIHDEDKELSICREKLGTKYKELLKECNKEKPLEKENIETIDFEKKIRELEYKLNEKKKEEGKVIEKIQIYNENLTALAEYESFTCNHNVQWDIELARLGREEIKKCKGHIISDYIEIKENIQKSRTELERYLNKIKAMEIFNEDYYQKPLESMLQLVENGKQVLKQLDTTIESYDMLIEKLLVDIAYIEKEKTEILHLLEEYVKEVNRNMNLIDRNSTITIRNKSVKMLKIEIPNWDENQSIYNLRLQDFIDEITERSVEILEKNENPMELIGTRVTTKGLFDAVVGIGNVQIKLYKIEAQKEYPITWAQVARNSGGEGFLSAFVILSSLLYYIRKDDTDIFSDGKEGKVLVMDNPFAQTNASHLLMPLMEMAKKTNTQLICLTGLGGESIYNCFNNIYVLTLVAANLRSGMEYLKSEHIRGSSQEEIISSQINIVEQQVLDFI